VQGIGPAGLRCNGLRLLANTELETGGYVRSHAVQLARQLCHPHQQLCRWFAARSCNFPNETRLLGVSSSSSAAGSSC
jgi:hypothetical protein